MHFIGYMDFGILNLIRDHLYGTVLDHIMPALSVMGNKGIVWLFFCCLMLLAPKYRRWGVVLGVSLLISCVIGEGIMKPLIGRLRPCDVNLGVSLLIPRPDGFSFPSGHTMSSFTAATVFFKWNRKLGTAAYVLAALIAFSRLFLYVHYPSDVAAGILMGIIVANLCVWFFMKRLNWSSKIPVLQQE